MSGDLEVALRQILKSVVREVADEVLHERRFSDQPIRPEQADQESRLLLRASEAAERLAISQRTLHTMTVKGVLPCVRLGRLVRYRVETIDRWICESETTDPAKTKQRTAIKQEPAKPAAAKKIVSKRKKSTNRQSVQTVRRKSTARPRKKPETVRRSSEPEPEEVIRII